MESKRCAEGTDDPNIFNSRAHPVAETFQGPDARELRRDDLEMRVAPAVVPRLCQSLNLASFGVSHIHFSPLAGPRSLSLAAPASPGFLPAAHLLRGRAVAIGEVAAEVVHQHRNSRSDDSPR